MVLKLNSYLLVIVCLFCFFTVQAHDPDKAYFKIEEAGGNIVVLAEFPWSIRKVIDNIKTDESDSNDLEVKLLKYVTKHMVLEMRNGDRLPILNIEPLKNKKEKHHSTANYKILFEGNQLYKVTNTLMCDYYKGQLNYHVLFDQSDSKITSVKNPNFVVQKSFSISGVKYILGVFLILTIAFIIYRLTKKH